MFKVYHVIDSKFGMKHQKFPNDFKYVANVEAENIDEVFRLTNHIHSAWYNNDGVEVLKRSRSTSVGDVIVSEEGVKYRCEFCGWSELD